MSWKPRLRVLAFGIGMLLLTSQWAFAGQVKLMPYFPSPYEDVGYNLSAPKDCFVSMKLAADGNFQGTCHYHSGSEGADAAVEWSLFGVPLSATACSRVSAPLCPSENRGNVVFVTLTTPLGTGNYPVYLQAMVNGISAVELFSGGGSSVLIPYLVWSTDGISGVGAPIPGDLHWSECPDGISGVGCPPPQ